MSQGSALQQGPLCCDLSRMPNATSSFRVLPPLQSPMALGGGSSPSKSKNKLARLGVNISEVCAVRCGAVRQ